VEVWAQTVCSVKKEKAMINNFLILINFYQISGIRQDSETGGIKYRLPVTSYQFPGKQVTELAIPTGREWGSSKGDQVGKLTG
jgi:hypothetical protein